MTEPLANTAGDLTEARAEEVSAILRVVANPNRLRLLCLLVEGERSVGEMEAMLGIRQPTLSQQLGALREAGLVSTRRVHKVVFYTLADDRAVALLSALHDVFCPAAATPPPGVRVPTRPPRARPAEAAVFATVGRPS
jgi:ArsR family transcriptional regulator